MPEEVVMPPLAGVGILRYPEGKVYERNGRSCSARDMARDFAENIQQGSILVLPNTRDEDGRYLWDFRIEGGDPGQVEIRRQGE